MPAWLGMQLHYRCVFDLAPAIEEAEWGDIVRTIRRWIADGQNLGQDQLFHRQWLFTGGEWQMPGAPRIRVSSNRFVGTGSEQAPQFWSLRYEHPCRDLGMRQWTTDIGLLRLDDRRVRFSLALMHRIMPGYIGPEPESPLPSAPRIVPTLVANVAWTATCGSQRLGVAPQPLYVGRGNELCDALASPDRLCPIVFVSRQFRTDAPLVDTHRLARLLAGAAVIIEAASKDVGTELGYLLPHDLRCVNGMVRVYQPHVAPDDPADGRRHRYFGRALIDQLGGTAVEDQIIRGITHRARILIDDVVTSLEDVETRRREARLAELRAAAADTTKDEYIALLDKDNTELHAAREALKGEIQRLKDDADRADGVNTELSNRLRRLEYERDNERKQRVSAEKHQRQLESRINAVYAIENLPESVPQIIELIAQLYPDRIAFTDRARKSADEAAINGQRGEMNTVWRCLRAMAIHLHDLVFNDADDQEELTAAFRRRSNFEMSLTEGGGTKKSKDLMKLRRDTYDGDEIEITPHVKFGSREPRCLRVHYHADHKRRLIIVGHCGDHLDTYGTRRHRKR
jgi:hypothetical protein